MIREIGLVNPTHYLSLNLYLYVYLCDDADGDRSRRARAFFSSRARAVDDVHHLEWKGEIDGEETVVGVVKRRRVRASRALDANARVVEDAARAHDAHVGEKRQDGGVDEKGGGV